MVRRWVGFLLGLLVVCGCGNDGGGGGGTGGTAPTLVDMQALEIGGAPRSGFARGSQFMLQLIIDDPEEDPAGGFISLYPGNDATPFFGPEPFSLEVVSAENGTYRTSPVTIPLSLPAGRYRFAAEVYDQSGLFSPGLYIWVDVV